MRKTILVTGANGQLGNELRVLAPAFTAYHFIFTDLPELSITDEKAVQAFFESHPIDVCINCAAYTAVDKAETDLALAILVNGDAPGYLAAACKAKAAQFIHISTDYVFDGNATEPYKTNHPVNPVNAYGVSKLKGEQTSFANNPDTIIIRTSWVYSSFGHNFVKTMLRLMEERESLNVVDDQVGCPTYAADLAAAIMHIVSSGIEAPGFYHYSNSGVISWFQFADAIRELSGSKCTVNPIPTAAYPTPAKRPAYSVMDTSKIKEVFHVAIPYWKDSLQVCLEKLS